VGKELNDLEEFMLARCTAELVDRGMRALEAGILEVLLSARFTGWVGMPCRSLEGKRGGQAVLVTPLVAVRDEEVRRVVAQLRAFRWAIPRSSLTM
jgi:hypothetical protein